MKGDFTESSKCPDLHTFRLIDMYHSAATAEMRDKIVNHFVQREGS